MNELHEKYPNYNFKVLIFGVRVLNTIPNLELLKDKILNFVRSGGSVIVQYSTANRFSKIDSTLWPHSMNVANLRVTDQNAVPKFLLPKHPVFSSYFKITENDFKNWVQERGLYFASDWDSRYAAPLAFADPKEDFLAGGLLVTKLDKGYFVYTGLSFFRQLPAGISGATKLFTNLLYLNNTHKK
jgi:hypothetical protein